jgi:hypothetical protein
MASGPPPNVAVCWLLRGAVGAIEDLGPRHRGAHRNQTSAEGLGETDHVGHQPLLVLEGAEASGPAHARLDLIDDQERAPVVAATERAGQIARRGGQGSPLAQHRLHHQRRHVAPAQHAIQGVEVVEGDALDAGHQRAVAVPEVRVVHQRQRAHGLAVVGPLHAHEPLLAGGRPGELDGSLHGLRAAGAEEHPLQVARQGRRQRLGGQAHVGRALHLREAREVARERRRERRLHRRVVVSQVQHAVAAEEIEVALPALVDELQPAGRDEAPAVAHHVEQIDEAGVHVPPVELEALVRPGLYLFYHLHAELLRIAHGDLLFLDAHRRLATVANRRWRRKRPL